MSETNSIASGGTVFTKTCNRCKTAKPLSEFYTRKAGGYYITCRPCSGERRKEWTAANPEKRAESNRKWVANNPDKNREKSRRYYYKNNEARVDYKREWDLANPERRILRCAKYRAKKLGIEFNLELSDIIIPEFCPVYGIPISRNTGGGKPADDSPSLDRFNNSKGYVKGNVAVVSYKANRLKNDAGIDDIRALLAYLEAGFGISRTSD